MSLTTFDPKNAVLIDWYEILLQAYPDIDLTDRRLCEEKLKDIDEKIFFIIERDAPLWLRATFNVDAIPVKHKKNLEKNYPELHKIVSHNFSPAWLLPSGIILDNIEHTGITAKFDYDGEGYLLTSDGSFILFKAELNESFLKRYLKKEDINTGELEYLEV